MINSMVDELIVTAENNRKDMDEKLSAAELCYNSAPNAENKAILDSIKTDTIKARYYLTLIKILKLLGVDESNYYAAVDKRKKIIDLINYRRSCLEKMGISFSIDPFSRVKLDSQIELINSFGDNDRELSSIKRKITSLSTQIDSMQSQNVSFLEEINHNKILPIEDKKVSLSIEPVGESLNDKVATVEEKETSFIATQVVKVTDTPIDFMLERAREKTSGVVSRVNELINKSSSDDVELDVSPELIIESSGNTLDEEARHVDDIFIDDAPTDLFTDQLPSTDLFVDEPPEIVDIPKTVDVSGSDSVSEVVNIPESVEFLETTPFDETPLFSDRSDDGLFDDKIVTPSVEKKTVLMPETKAPDSSTILESQIQSDENGSDMEMPDLFWDMQEVEHEEDTQDNVISFEEGLAKLNLTEDNDVKTRRLVA